MQKNSDNKVKINNFFIIHLDRATKRKKQVNFLKNIIPFKVSIVSAVDGEKLSNKVISSHKLDVLLPRYPFNMRSAEIATFLSHRKCWQKIIDDKLEGAVIIEDDVEINSEFFDYNLDVALINIKQGDFIRFPISKREKPNLFFTSNKKATIFKPVIIGLGMQVQIVTKDAALSLLKDTKTFDRPVDTYLQLKWKHKLKILTVIPSGISEISNNLGGSLIGDKKSLLGKFLKEIIRPAYRFKIYFLSMLYYKR